MMYRYYLLILLILISCDKSPERIESITVTFDFTSIKYPSGFFFLNEVTGKQDSVNSRHGMIQIISLQQGTYSIAAYTESTDSCLAAYDEMGYYNVKFGPNHAVIATGVSLQRQYLFYRVCR